MSRSGATPSLTRLGVQGLRLVGLIRFIGFRVEGLYGFGYRFAEVEGRALLEGLEGLGIELRVLGV